MWYYSVKRVDKSLRSVTRVTAADFIVCMIDVAFKRNVPINNEQTVSLLVNNIASDTLTRHMILWFDANLQGLRGLHRGASLFLTNHFTQNCWRVTVWDRVSRGKYRCIIIKTSNCIYALFKQLKQTCEVSTVLGIKRLQNMSHCRKEKRIPVMRVLHRHIIITTVQNGRTMVIEKQLKGIGRK